MSYSLDDNGDPFGVDTAPVLTESDRSEWAKMTAYTPAPNRESEGSPWWQNLVSYGVTKAIDNTFPNEQHNIRGNTGPGSFAGQNGRTYNQRGSQNAPPMESVGNLVSSFAGMSPLVLAGIAAALFFAFKS